MTCFTPLKAYRQSGGGIAFSSKEGFGDLPLDLPCGQCVGCLVKRARHWALRCVHEASLHEKNCFVTLTYSPDITYRVHRGKRVRYGLPEDGSLDVEHWQTFAKRLRKRLGKFRFLHVGEYGERNFRPHYHAVLFGIDFPDKVLYRRKGETSLYTSAILQDTWGHGFCTVGALTYESAGYTARYCLKKRGHRVQTERYRRIDLATGEEYYVRHEYVTMSRRPGLGYGWFQKFRSDVFPADEVIHGGLKFGVPRYYDNLEEIDAERRNEAASFIALKAARVQRAKAHLDECSSERLRVREAVALSQLSVLVREIE